MSYCPKCGTPVASQMSSQPVRYQDRSMIYLTVGIIAAVAAVVIIIAALIAVGLIPGGPVGPIIGSGNVQTQQIIHSDFTAIQVSSGFNVQIIQSSNYSIKVTADDNILKYILVDKTDSTLTIRLKPGIGFTTTTLKAEISMPDLKTAQLSGGVIGKAQGFTIAHDFTANLSGGSRLTMTGQASNLMLQHQADPI